MWVWRSNSFHRTEACAAGLIQESLEACLCQSEAAVSVPTGLIELL